MKKRSNKKNDSPESILAETTVQDSALHERIARKAYELYEKRGCVHGLDTEDWLEAERLVLAESRAGMKTDPIAKAKMPPRKRTMPNKSGSVLGKP